VSRRLVVGELAGPEALVRTVEALRGEQHGVLDAHTPYPVHGLDEALGLHRSTVPWWAFAGGAIGAVTGFGLQLYFNFVLFPLNVGNRPAHAPPPYVPITFELMVLFSALTIVASLVFRFWGFPRPHHPVFEHEPFVKTASTTGFWVSVAAVAESAARTAERLQALGATNVAVIEERGR
jgi:hypothetical protein